jgi:hypothetical protein
MEEHVLIMSMVISATVWQTLWGNIVKLVRFYAYVIAFNVCCYVCNLCRTVADCKKQNLND